MHYIAGGGLWLGGVNEARDNKQGHNAEFGGGRRRLPTVSFSQAAAGGVHSGRREVIKH